MPKRPLEGEARLEQQYRRLRTRKPICVCCGETDPFCLELHHLAGHVHHDDVVIVCRNCHRKLTNHQRNHVSSGGPDPSEPLAMIGHYLEGLADLLLMIAETLREFGKLLIEYARGEIPA